MQVPVKQSAEEVIVEPSAQVVSVTLNRPKALNALTPVMVDLLTAGLKAWATDPRVRAVIVRGAAREDGKVPFCAGGDLRMLYEGRTDSARRLATQFYADEYHLNRLLFRFPKPHVALIDGVVMGGGVGVSLHGSHRVMTERTLFAMPETGIGLFPDVGASYFLPRCPGHFGLYLGLTGARIGAADALYLGLGTHFVPSANIAALDRALCEADFARDPKRVADAVIATFARAPAFSPLAQHRPLIDRCFSAPRVEEILRRLAADGSPFASETAALMASKSPTSLKITLRQLTAPNIHSFDDAMRLEFRLALHCNRGHDFFEGIRALLIDRDQAPKWQPARLEEVSEAMVESYFTRSPAGDLVLD